MDNLTQSFEEKFEEIFLNVIETDFLEIGETLGIKRIESSLIFHFFNSEIDFSSNGVHDLKRHLLTPAIKYVLSNYLLIKTDLKLKNAKALVSLRELSNSGPLFSSFTTNKGKIIETTYSEKLSDLEKRCIELGGRNLENPSYDLSYEFLPFKNVPIILNFNDKDEMMGSSSVFLFQEDVLNYLDLESVSIISTYLTGLLIKNA
ncbi:MAG: DUF3786 domain-containing protein [Desulfobacterales bacterium]|nr:DUF3786 domain-containing protein [Desulfobacterales bacterium]MCP4161474.1 DUF3786 domain-containing protein [Deltaproteobacteria bacterium]